MEYKVGFYLRLSKKDENLSIQDTSNSIINQRTILENELKKRNSDAGEDTFNFVGEYIDDGISGTDFRNRPQFLTMLKDIEAKKINCVFFKDLSRMFRNHVQAGEFFESFCQQHKVRLIAVFDDFDTKINNGYDFTSNLKNLINEDYSRRLSANIKRIFEAKASNGEFIGAQPAYGFIRDPEHKNKLLIDEEAANVVRQIYTMFLAGASKSRIAAVLRNAGVLCPTEYKKSKGINYVNSNKLDSTTSWTYSTVNKILKSEIYHGTLVSHKENKSKFNKGQKLYDKNERVIVENAVPKIISDEDWNEAQRLLTFGKKDINFNQNISVFAGHIYCGDCGRAMSKTQIKNKKLNKTYTRYVCRKYKSEASCSSHSINEEILVNTILNQLNNYIKKVKDLKKLIDNSQNVKKIDGFFEIEISEHNKEIKAIEKQIENLLLNSSFCKTEETSRIYKDTLKKLETKLQFHNKEIKRLKNSSPIENAKQFLESEIAKEILNTKKFNRLTKEIVDTFVNKIVVYDGEELRVEIEYNFKENLFNIL